MVAVFIAFSAITVRLVQLQVVQHDRHKSVALENSTRTTYISAVRGEITDVHRKVLATNEPSYSVFVTPQWMSDRQVTRFCELMELTEDKCTQFQQRLDSITGRRRTHQIRMFEGISRDQVATMETHAREFAGVDVVLRPRRVYPYGPLGGHVIGYMNEATAEDVQRDGFYRSGDRIGRTGVERGGTKDCCVVYAGCERFAYTAESPPAPSGPRAPSPTRSPQRARVFS